MDTLASDFGKVNSKLSKGERTERKILDAAQSLFATHGYEGTSLRQIAELVGIREPGLYNYFASKQALYEAVLARALNPLADAMERQLENASHLRDYTELPALMTDLLLEHPQMAALFQLAMQGDSSTLGNQLMSSWLERLLNLGMRSMEEMSAPDVALDKHERAGVAINLIAMFNITTGYFLSQRAFATLVEGDLTEPENIARQKRLLHKMIRTMLIA